MIEKIFREQKEFRSSHNIQSVEERINKLKKIHNWILNNRSKIQNAIKNDFEKCEEETDITEIYPVIAEIKDAKKNIKKWAEPIKVKKTRTFIVNPAYIKYEPRGVTLIISPWNYPFMLAISPLISSIAAGNSIILKPSEISNYTSDLIYEMINELFDPKEIVVIRGGKNIATKLLVLPFDHIFFTGSTNVGKIIARAAAENLSSYTLELGGKSPVIVDKTANLNLAAEKIVWGKFLNKGQTCVAPDYILVEKSVREQFTELLIFNIKKFYGNDAEDVESNLNYPKIINDHHQNRLINLIDNAVSNGCQILYGGKYNKQSRFIEPTIILTNCSDCSISEEEIFGPLLPLIEYDSIEEAINWINKRNSPLAIYIFSETENIINVITSSTQSGGVGINEVVLQFGHQNLPFGGVGSSGTGRSHGYSGFKAFSNERSYIKGGKINLLKLIYPPYNNRTKKFINLMIKYL